MSMPVLSGSDFLYTSHGWTLVSAVIEAAAGESFAITAKQMFYDLGLKHTYLDEASPLIYNRTRYNFFLLKFIIETLWFTRRTLPFFIFITLNIFIYLPNITINNLCIYSYYVKNKQGRLKNASYVDVSYKWAAGGFLSTVCDLCQFGDAMLCSYQDKGGYMKPDTTHRMWTPIKEAPCSWDKDANYALGWCSVSSSNGYGSGRHVKQYVSHTGSAVGASSVLLVMPNGEGNSCSGRTLPQGVCVAIMVNLQSVGLSKMAVDLATIFDEVIS